MRNVLQLILGWGLTVVSLDALAEPWLATRYAQNCAGCHAPGRKNLSVPKRRCTLSCQGCHVNPNGGGLRSYYGKWNEERWLRSFATEAFGSRKPTAPVTMQKYGQKKHKYRKGKKEPQGGFDLVELKKIPSDAKEALYDRRDGLERIIGDRAEFEYQVPIGDPYREMDRNKIDGGADFRWLTRQSEISLLQLDQDGNTLSESSQQSWASFPMVVDLQLGVRPLYRKYRLVYEVRATDLPRGERSIHALGANGQTVGGSNAQLNRRSLYFMADDLPYNLFVMAGYYRPMIGYFTPDHTLMPQVLQASVLGAPYMQEFLAVSAGGSPNVPYANVHFIARGTNPSRENLSGVGANLGARFVTLGISVNYSGFRLTDSEDPNAPVSIEIHSLYGSIQLSRLTLTLDLQSIGRDDPKVDFRQGGVATLDAYLQLWRANYLTAQYAYATSAKDLGEGSVTQSRWGVRSFLLAGVDISLLYESEYELRQATQTAVNRQGWMGQLHLYM